MTKSNNLLVVLLALVLINILFTFYNSTKIKSVGKLILNTEKKLTNTITIMDEMAEFQKEREEEKKPLEKGSQAPNFKLQDETLKNVSLDDLKGSKTLLIFSQADCPNCEDFYSVLNEFQAIQGEIPVIILIHESDAEANKAYKEKFSLQASILAASNDDFLNYKIQKTPASVFIDEEGKIIATATVNNLEDLLNFVM